MKYVTDLSKVKPEEIRHVCGYEVLGIFIEKEAEDKDNEVLVVMMPKTGGLFSEYYFISGQCLTLDEASNFVYKPKTIRYLKPLHQVLAENPYYFGGLGTIYFDDLDTGIGATELCLFDGTHTDSGWPDSFYYEKEETL
jgi:hypothetical protein